MWLKFVDATCLSKVLKLLKAENIATCGLSTSLTSVFFVQHLSNSKRKELKKQLRKQQASERKRQRQVGLEPDDFAADDSEVILVKDIGCLSI